MKRKLSVGSAGVGCLLPPPVEIPFTLNIAGFVVGEGDMCPETVAMLSGLRAQHLEAVTKPLGRVYACVRKTVEEARQAGVKMLEDFSKFLDSKIADIQQMCAPALPSGCATREGLRGYFLMMVQKGIVAL